MKKNIVFALILATYPAYLHALEPSNFVEDDQPFIRSALIVSEEPLNRVRRGVLISLGENLWTSFDPDLLRYAAIWKTPTGKAPLSMDSMAGVSYPDEKAKADKIPELVGEIIATSPELPGAWLNSLPASDIREGSLLQGQGKVGQLPAASARWQGLSLRGNDVVLSYRIGSRQILETSRALSSDLIERIISVEQGKQTVAIRLSGTPGIISRSGASVSAVLDEGGMKHVNIAGNGQFKTTSSAAEGLGIQISSSTDTAVFRILFSSEPIQKIPEFRGFPESAPAKSVFPGEIKITRPTPGKQDSPLEIHDLNLPSPNPWKRAVRPTDIAFLSDGTALISTLDGDVWRVTDIEKTTATWTRAAFGIFEPMSIATNSKDEVFVLGRDQITHLEDTNKDGFFDNYICASDAFNQTLHTRDYATSLELEDDGSFLIARAGLTDDKKSYSNENAVGRGSILRISADGNKVTTLADGLRVPYIGRRSDGSIFSSDQQGHFIPSSPIHLISGDNPYLGYEPSDFRKKKIPVPPLLWLPYQINRSGASFASLSEKGFGSLGGAFTHLSWSGRIFPIETPAKGLPFAWKLPVDFDFPLLGAATHPLNGKLYAVGIGISGYKPTTPKTIGLAEISERHPIVSPKTFIVDKESITIGFRKPLPLGISLTTQRPELDLWNIKRTAEYGSGHFRWDGNPGEHSITVGGLTIAPDRRSITLAIPGIFYSDILRLRLNIHDTVSSSPPYQIELYTCPSSLVEATSSDLAAIAKREDTAKAPLVAGNAKRGAILFTNFGCIGCHSLTGEKLTGPPVNGIATRHPENLEAYLKQSILEPNAVIAEGYEAAMPTFAGVISEQDIAHLIAYISEL